MSSRDIVEHINTNAVINTCTFVTKRLRHNLQALRGALCGSKHESVGDDDTGAVEEVES